MKNYKTVLILLAGGNGSRFANKKPKQFTKVFGRMIIEYTLDKLSNINFIDEIYLVYNKDCEKEVFSLKDKYEKIVKYIVGGTSRGESIKNAVNNIEYPEKTKVIIHDSVRPLINKAVIKEIIKKLDLYDAVQTVLTSDNDCIIDNNFYHRNKIQICSGPEAANIDILKHAYCINPQNSVINSCLSVSNKIATVESNPENIKITYKKDIITFKNFLKESTH